MQSIPRWMKYQIGIPAQLIRQFFVTKRYIYTFRSTTQSKGFIKGPEGSTNKCYSLFLIQNFMNLYGHCSLRLLIILKPSNIVKFHVNKYSLLTPQDLYSISSCPISMTTQQVTKKFQRIIYPQPNTELFIAVSRHYCGDTYRVKLKLVQLSVLLQKS